MMMTNERSMRYTFRLLRVEETKQTVSDTPQTLNFLEDTE